MIITKTPFRISFFGGGTDIEEYFAKYGGAVISSTIDKYCYVTVRRLPPFFDYKSQISYSKIERVKMIDEIRHPIVRETMRRFNMNNLIITYDADLPARTGLGTSSSFAVGLINAFYGFNYKYIGKEDLSKEAIFIERNLCNESGGWQDQIAASFGGLNRIDFSIDGFHVKPIVMSKDRKNELNKRLLLFFTGLSRNSAEIQDDVCGRISHNITLLHELHEVADYAEKVFIDNDKTLDELGKLLDYSWNLKKNIGAAVSNDSINRIYRKGMEAGALGGKLLGAGGGGFMLFYVPLDRQKDVTDALGDLKRIPFEFTESGSQIIYYDD